MHYMAHGTLPFGMIYDFLPDAGRIFVIESLLENCSTRILCDDRPESNVWLSVKCEGSIEGFEPS